ncbi:MAG: glycine dehydrogenase (aminomethyl-transferring), partial [Myxococcota bacterium]|nr:glycine dehydrogenase (aminomethyl-transferring) [Myxococcota bacterium]
IRTGTPLEMHAAGSEHELLLEAQRIAEANTVSQCYIGMGYHPCVVPPVILRNILCNPGWYTQYTPYQAEISQGRLEALLNFQTMICDLTGMDIANSSMLDEGTSAAEGMTLCYNVAKGKRNTFLVANDCNPQTLEVVQTRALPLGIHVEIAAPDALNITDDVFGVLVSYPSTDGTIRDWTSLCTQAHDQGAMVVVVADILSLALLKSPGAIGADIAVGTTQRFGVPMGFGGPHAAYFATHDKHKRRIPGRLVGVSKDANGDPALRLALQTREQHIRRDRATSNICTAQVLLAVMAAMYGTYHGPEGLRRIAARVRRLTDTLATCLSQGGLSVQGGPRFDTVTVTVDASARADILGRANAAGVLLRELDADRLSASLNEATLTTDLDVLAGVLTGANPGSSALEAIAAGLPDAYDAPFTRESAYLQD